MAAQVTAWLAEWWSPHQVAQDMTCQYHFILPAEGPLPNDFLGAVRTHPRHAILVKCTVSTHECERAGNEFTLGVSDQLNLT